MEGVVLSVTSTTVTNYRLHFGKWHAACNKDAKGSAAEEQELSQFAELMMIMSTKWFAVIAALNLVFGIGTRAQDAQLGTDSGLEPVVDSTHVSRPERPHKPERPDRPEKSGMSQEMKELVTEFRSKVSEFHAEQKDLLKKLKTATEEERAQIREQLKANREELQQVKEEYRDSVKDLSEGLKDHTAKIAAEIKTDARHGRGRD